MKIGMILEHPFPFDIRVEKEIQSLTEAGYEIFLLCRQSSGSSSRSIEKGEGITIVRVKVPLIHRLLAEVTRFLYNVDIFWYLYIRKFIKSYHVDALHVHDLPLVNTAYLAARKKIPVIADLHEVFPAHMQVLSRDRRLGKNRIVRFIRHNYQRWLIFERSTLHKIFHVITVVDEAKERLIKLHSLPESKITVISNYEPKNSIVRKMPNNCKKWSPFKKSFMMSYVGSYGSLRGLHTVVAAISHVLKKHELTDLKFVIVGRGAHSYKQYLKTMIKKLNLSNHVQLFDLIPFSEVPCVIHYSTVGIIPHSFNELTDNTVPHKLFQYMIAGRPVIVSSCRPLKRIVEETQCGMVFEADNPKSLSNVIWKAYNNPELLEVLGKNGRKAVLEGKYNWDEEGKKLVQLYDDLENHLKSFTFSADNGDEIRWKGHQ